MRYILLLLFYLLTVVSYSQKNQSASLKLADQAFKDMRYAYAIPFYKSYLKKNGTDTAVLLKLGYCYKINNVYDSAIHYYELAENFGAAKTNVLAELYASEGNYKKAITAYQTLLDALKEIDNGLTKVYKTRLMGFKNIHRLYRDSINYTLYHLSINTPYNEYNAVPYNGGIVFESNRDTKITKRNEFGWDGSAFTKLYYVADTGHLVTDSIQKYEWTDKRIKKGLAEYSILSGNDNNKLTPRFDIKTLTYHHAFVPLFSKGLDINVNYGAISFTSDGNTAYFTKNQKNEKGESHLEIWQADKNKEGEWRTVQKLPFVNPLYSYFHPAITADGNRLYFASDVAGGYGGTDIYYAEKKDGKWGEPINAGAIINTAANELFPTIYNGDLYFSSNGHEGLGGLDIYQFEGKDLNTGRVVNLGYPINTSKDEFGFSQLQNKGYFNSNRYGSDDILAYNFSLVKIKLKGKLDIAEMNPNDTIMVRIYNKDELAAKKTIDQAIDSVLIDKAGNYSFAVLPGVDYILNFEKTGIVKSSAAYEILTDQYKKINGAYTIEIPLLKGDKLFPKTVGISPIQIIADDTKKDRIYDERRRIEIEGKEINRVAEQYTIYYAFNKNVITIEYAKGLDSAIDYLKNHRKLFAVIASFTDCAGSAAYNDKLSANRSAAVIAYLTAKGISRNKIIEGHYGKAYLLKACEEAKYDQAAQWQNRRTEILISEVSSKTWTDIHREKK